MPKNSYELLKSFFFSYLLPLGYGNTYHNSFIDNKRFFTGLSLRLTTEEKKGKILS